MRKVSLSIQTEGELQLTISPADDGRKSHEKVGTGRRQQGCIPVSGGTPVT